MYIDILAIVIKIQLMNYFIVLAKNNVILTKMIAIYEFYYNDVSMLLASFSSYK